MPAPEFFIGIMSGTSLDGIDVALVDLAAPAPHLAGSHFQPYDAAMKATLLALHHPDTDELHQAQLVSNQLARDYAHACLTLLSKCGVNTDQVRAIGCHGQTVRHRPEHGYTVQLNNAALLAELTGITVIGDFRSRDIAAGGQGAPLVPAFHHQVLRHPEIHRTIINIGGIANLTHLPPGQITSGFDCGPGNLLMDAWIFRHLGADYDKNGNWAACGTILPELLARCLSEDFFSLPPPKSTGRDLFNLDWLCQRLKGNESAVDVQATLLALTGQSIASAVRNHCPDADEIYLCGGGAHNTALKAFLNNALPHCRIELTNALGIDADWMEAIAFAWLSKQCLEFKPSNLPVVTGARHGCILGAIYPGKSPQND